MANEELERRRVMERHVQSIILTFILGTLGWAAVTLQASHDSTLKQGVLVEILQNDMNKLRRDLDLNIDSRYRATDAQRDFAIINARFDMMEARMDRWEKKK